MNALLAGLTGFWIWTVLNDEEGLFRPVNRWMQRGYYRRKWMSCPWCSGAWFALAATLGLRPPDDSIARTIVTALAAAAITGMLGSYFGED